LDELLQPLSGKTDLIVLPEMFPTGFSMNVAHIARCAAPVLSWMRQQAKATGAVIMGSMAVRINRNYYNRFYWLSPDGGAGHYDKHHLFSMSDEPEYFTGGKKRHQFSWKGWEIRPIVCYDLRFPAWCRNTCQNTSSRSIVRKIDAGDAYDILICPASWPAARSDVWSTLLKARALENQCFVAGVNRIGTDNNGLVHNGHSAIYGPKGEIIGLLQDEETVATFTLYLRELQAFRKKFQVLEDMDDIFLII
jgi:predicted amidohydrolase